MNIWAEFVREIGGDVRRDRELEWRFRCEIILDNEDFCYEVMEVLLVNIKTTEMFLTAVAGNISCGTVAMRLLLTRDPDIIITGEIMAGVTGNLKIGQHRSCSGGNIAKSGVLREGDEVSNSLP